MSLRFSHPLVAREQQGSRDHIVVHAFDNERSVAFYIPRSVARRHLRHSDVVLHHVLCDWNTKIEKACCSALKRSVCAESRIDVSDLDFFTVIDLEGAADQEASHVKSA